MNNDLILIFGRRGCGKTSLAKNLIKKEPRVIVFDTLGEYNFGIKVSKFQDFAHYCMKYRFAPALKLVYYPSEEDIKYIFNVVCRMLNEIKDITFVVEELGQFLTSSSYPQSLNKLIRSSRHNNVSVIGITHRPADVLKVFRGLSTKIITFQQIEPSDIRYLEKIFDSEIVKKVRNLKPFEYLEYDGYRISFNKTTKPNF